MANVGATMAGEKTRHLSWDWNDNEPFLSCKFVQINQTETFDLSQVPGFNILATSGVGRELAFYGAKQFLADRAAAAATAPEKREAMLTAWNTILSGVWSDRRSTGPRDPAPLLFMLAIARVKNLPLEAVKEKLAEKAATMDPADFKKWVKDGREDKKVAAAEAAIRAEQAREAAKAAKAAPETDVLSDF